MGVGYWMKTRKEILTKRLKEIDKKITGLFHEQSTLSNALFKIKIDELIDSDILSTVEWKYVPRRSSHNFYFDSLSDCYEPKEIFDLAGFAHDNIAINKYVDLSFDDGRLSLIIDPPGLKYIREYNLKINTDDLEELIKTKNKEVEEFQKALEYIRNT